MINEREVFMHYVIVTQAVTFEPYLAVFRLAHMNFSFILQRSGL